MMEPILFSLGALAAWIAAIAVYQFAIAFVATSFGIRVHEISIGFGTTVFRRVGRSWTIRLGILPLGGYTKFLSRDDQYWQASLPFHREDNLNSVCYEDAYPLVQMLIQLGGPLAVAFLGILCLAAPVWMETPQLQKCSADESMVHPVGVEGLLLRNEPSSVGGQLALFRDTAVEYAIRLVTLQSLEGWGGLLSFFVTCGGIGALSFPAWLSAVGVVLLWFGLINLLPVPLLNGFHFLMSFGRWIRDFEFSEKGRVNLTYCSLAMMLVLMVRSCWVDFRWLWSALFG